MTGFAPPRERLSSSIGQSRCINPSFAKFRVTRAEGSIEGAGGADDQFVEIESSSVGKNEEKDEEDVYKYATSNPLNPNSTPQDYTQKLLDFLDDTPTAYHAVAKVSKELEEKGFVYLPERESWDDKIASGTKFYTKRNDSSLMAFVIGADWKPGNGVALIGSHIDALSLRLKPISLKDSIDNFELLGVAPYSGALNPSWLDRDLSLGGRVLIQQGGSITTKLVNIPYPIAMIPTLAVHFGTPSNPPFNPETELVPVTGIGAGEVESDPTEDEKQSPLYGKHSLKLLRLISRYLGIPVRDFLQVDLELFDGQKSTVGGIDSDFVFGPRMDDKLCSFAAYKALIESLETTCGSSSISAVTLYDNEEIGSGSRQGAQGNIFEGTIDRVLSIYLGKADDAIKKLTYANSFFISADVIHAVNPNFSNVYLEHHKPNFNIGLTISWDPNGHMTTDGVSAVLVEEIARRTGDKLQYFQIRNDSRSGGTIGPYLSTKTGMRAVEMGIPMWQMHSIRNTTGSKDAWLSVRFFKNFFEKWEEVDAELRLGGL